ncbi:MAG: T9SS type A sorting domain-containing protein [Bacteroidetes bacterium]|nr:T9SS type A sorting domain-containing protein [Bacteroidota bacterium]
MKTKITLKSPGLLKLALMALTTVLLPGMLSAQLTGTRNIPGDYATLAAAITDLNTQGVGAGGVTLNLIAGNPETAPAGGYQITASGSLANPIIIQGNANVITAFTPQATGSLTDAIFKIIGGDFIAINGFVMQENPANTVLTPTASNTMTEWGVALFASSATDGAQNNAIAGNTISLNRTYGNTWGVYSNTRHSATVILIVTDASSPTGANSNNRVLANIISNVNYGVAFIGTATAANMDSGNDIGGNSPATGNTITNWGGLAAPSSYVSNTGTSYCIFMNNQIGENVSYNSLTSAAVSGTAVTFRGIYKTYGISPAGTFTVNITNNTLTMTNGFTSGTFEHIRSESMGTLVTATININNNTILNSAITGAASSSTIVGIINSSGPGVLNMNSNVIRGLTSTATTGGLTGISNTGAVVSSININSNQIGNASGNAITFSATTSGAVLCLNNNGGANSSALSISNNNFQGIIHSLVGSGTQFYMVNTAATLSQTFNNNTFTNLTANTTAEVRFMANNVALPAGGSVTVTGNSIVTAFSKPAAGSTVTLYYTTTSPSSVAGTTKTHQNNNFSNITLTGATTMAGWADLEGTSFGGPAKNISNNTFSNWACGSSAVTVIQTNYNSTNTIVSNNTISSISGTGAITGILMGSFSNGANMTVSNNTITGLVSSGTGGNVIGCTGGSSSITTYTITQNTISGLSSTGATVTGLVVSAGSTIFVTRNKIGDLLSTNTNPSVNGITVSGGVTNNVNNNLIGDLRATAANVANAINGINITGGTTSNIYFNTILLNATSSGALFGTSGIFTSTTSSVDLRNNLVVNLSTPNGTGLTVAYRRSSTILTSLAAASNNNAYFAGTPGPNNVIFFDGSNIDQTLAAYQARVSAREAASVSVNPVFTSTAVGNAGFLHIPAATSYLLESGGTNIAGITNDFDNDTRPGPAGSVNGGAISPDIGADEYDGFLVGCTGTPTAGTAASTPAARCASGTFSLSLTGASTGPGITYQWQSSAVSGGPYTNISGANTSSYTTGTVSATTYFVCVVTCSLSGLTATTNEVTGLINPLPLVAVTPTTANFCSPGGTPVSLTGSGANTYAWAPATGLSATTGATVTASPAATTTYTVTGTDVNGCVNTAVTTITSVLNPVITSVTATPASICTGNNSQLQGNITFNTPVNTYSFASGTGASLDPMTGAATAVGANVDDTPSGVIPIGFTFNFNGVNYTDFSVSPDGWLRMGNVAPTSQFTNSVTSTTNIPKLYPYWDDITTGTNGGVTYVVTGTAPNRILKVQWFVTVPYNFTGPANSTCQAWLYESTNVVEFRYGTMGITGLESASGGLTGGAGNFQSLTFGTGTVSTSAANNTNINPPASGVIYTFTPPVPTYSWSPATFLSSTSIINPVATAATATTTYTFTATNAVCSNNSPVTLTVNPLPAIGASASASAICIGASANLTATGGVTYNWMPGSLTGATVTVSPVSTTTYTVTGTDANGCQNTAQITITVNPLPSVNASASPAAICDGSTANLSATGAVSYTWMPGSLSGAAVAVTPSATTTYTVTGTDANGCENTAQTTVTVNSLPTVNASASATSICAGASTTLSATGANTYVWNPGNLSGASVSVSPAATTTYTVTGTDANGCNAVSTITITVNPLPAVSASASPAAVCIGSSSTLSATGAVTYVWNPGNLSGASVSVTPSATTTYTVTGTDANGCENTDVATVTVNALPTVTASASATSVCIGSSTTLNASGAVSYNWMPGSLSGASVSVSPAATTTYTVTGTDANGCVNTAQLTITVNPLPTVSAAASPAAVCPGGSSTLSGSGATTYVWNPGNLSGASVSVTPAATTTYTVTGTNANGCVNTDVVTVTVNTLPTVDATASPLTICAGGSSTLSATGAATYSWMPGSLSGASVSVTPAATTTYTVTGTDANGCVNTDVVSVTVNPLPVITASATNAAICTGSSTTLSATGGVSYTWNPGALSGSSVSVSPTTSTTYTVSGTDANGCVNTDLITIIVNPLPVVTASASSTSICTGNSVTLTAGGASTYTWNPGALTGSSVSVTPAATTTYTVTGTDVNGCVNTATVTITVGAQPTITAATSSAAICVGGSATLTATGGVTYNWMPGSLSGASVSVSPTTTTTYTVTGTVSAGCFNTATVTVTVNPLPVITASATATTLCNGSSTTLSATGASTYTWNPGALTGASVSVTPSATTTYTVTGVDANGCSNTQTITITVNPLPAVTASSSAAAICNGGNATLTATGANTYVWNPGNLSGASVVVSPTATTTYTVTGTNTATGCTNTATVSVTVNPLPSITATATQLAVCAGGSSTLSATGANTYVWNPGSLSGSSVSVTPSATTTYTVTGTNTVTGCVNTQTITITVNPLPTVAASTSAAAICNGGSATLSATGANTYVWNPGNLSGASVSVSPTATTTYTVTGTLTATGCTNTATVAVTVNPLPVITASTSAPAICAGGSATLTATGGNTYVWNPGNLSGATLSVSPTATTTYTVTGTNTVTGCSNTRTVTVTVNPLPVVTASSAAAAICLGGSTTLTATGANTYVWNPGNLSGSSVSVSPTGNTTYTVTGTITATGCTNTATVSVTVNPLPTVAATTSAATICAGATATLSATGANTYVWNPGNLSGSSVNVSPVTTTTYTVTGTNTLTGCTNTQTVTVNVNPLPVLTITPSATSICNGNSVTLNVTGANTYTWNPGSLTGASVTVFLSSTTTFTVTGVNTITGCINTQTVTITVNPLPVVTATASPLSICAGSNTTLSATGANTYVWNPGNLSGASVSVAPATSTVYTVTGTNTVTGCTATQSVSVNVDPLPVITASASSSVICFGQSALLTASGASSYVWTPGNISGASVNVIPGVTTTYTVTGTNSVTGCSNTQTITITVNPLPVVTATASSLTSCAGSPVTLNAGGAGIYNWQPGNLSGSSVTVNPVVTTTYTVTGTNTLTGCTGTRTITITVNQLPLITASAAQAVICAGGSSNLTASGANTYVWNPGNLSGAVVTVTPAATTTYTVTGTNTVTGCVNTQTVTVIVNALPVVAASSASAAICVGDTTTLTGTGANTYTWNPGNLSGSSVSVSPVATTTYTVTGTNTVTGCVNTATVSVTVNALPVLAASSSSAAICVGDSATLSVTGADSYTWNPGNLSGASVNVAPVATTTYTVTGTNTVTGCVNTTTVAVTVNSLPVVALGADTAVCGGPLTLDAGNAGSTYLWSDSSTAQTLSVTASGVYAVTVTNANGCEAVDSIAVTINALPVVSLGADTTVCGSLVLDAGNAGASYLWSDSTTAQTLTATSSGVYAVMVTDSLGCSTTDTIAVNVNALPAVNLGNDVTACAGGPVQLDAGVAGMLYNWNTGDTTQTIFATTTGVFVVTATDSLGCSATDSVNVSFSALPLVNLGNDTTLCGGSVTLDAGTGGNIFTWSTGDTTQTIVAASTALYGVTVTDSLGCSSTDSVLVTINAIPVVTVSLTQDTLCDQDSLFVLLGSPAGGTFGGAFVSGNTFDPVAAGVGSHVVYYTFTDANGCSATDSATVIVDPCTGVAENAFNGSIFTVYPNPNNGFFNLALTNANYAELSIQVYTVLGQVVYSDMASNVTGDVIRPIDLTNFANGAYYVKVTTGSATQTIKVMKQD